MHYEGKVVQSGAMLTWYMSAPKLLSLGPKMDHQLINNSESLCGLYLFSFIDPQEVGVSEQLCFELLCMEIRDEAEKKKRKAE